MRSPAREIVATVGGIYRLIDMGSTTISVMGDLVETSIVAYSERAEIPAQEMSE